MEVYIDDIVVKTKKSGGDAHDLVEVFEMLRQHKLHLHAEKCAFGVGSGKFLGYMITTQDIEVNPNQITAIQQLCPPNNPKEVQRLIGMIAALTRFVSRSADRYKSFYKLLKKWKGFQWTEECYMTFKDLNSYLASSPILSRLEPEEDLYTYLAKSDHVVSSILIRK